MTRSLLDLPLLQHSPAWALMSDDERQFVRTEDWLDGPQSFEELLPYLEYATELTEFSAHAQSLGLSNVLVGRGKAWLGTEAGFCYSSNEYPELSPNSIFVIAPNHKPPHLSLVDIFIHEAAHLFTNGESHSWNFLVMLNVMRLRCGLNPSADPYDWGDLQHLPEIAGSSLSESSIRDSGAHLGRSLSNLPCELREIQFMVQSIWEGVLSEIANRNRTVEFEALCGRHGMQEIAKRATGSEVAIDNSCSN